LFDRGGEQQLMDEITKGPVQQRREDPKRAVRVVISMEFEFPHYHLWGRLN
jgi:hypothetical protein